MSTAPRLTSSEHRKVSDFVLATPDRRAEILAEAIQTASVSGALIEVYRYLLTV